MAGIPDDRKADGDTYEGRCFTCRDWETIVDQETGESVNMLRGQLRQFEGRRVTTPDGVTVAMGPCPVCGDRILVVLGKPAPPAEGSE